MLGINALRASEAAAVRIEDYADTLRGHRVLHLVGKGNKPATYRMVARIAKAAGIPRHISPHSLRHAAITSALDAGVPLRDAQILARHADPRTTEHYDRARGKPRPSRRPLPHRLRRRRLTRLAHQHRVRPDRRSSASFLGWMRAQRSFPGRPVSCDLVKRRCPRFVADPGSIVSGRLFGADPGWSAE